MPLCHPSHALARLAPTRRSFILTSGAALTAGLSARASAQAAPRVVIVGGGWGGLSAARNIKRTLPNAVVTLVEPKSAFMSCPMSIHYIVGQRSAESLTFSFAALLKSGVQHLAEPATAIDIAKRVVVTGTQRLSYDYLVLSPGIDYMENAIPGFAEHKAKLPIGFRSFEQQAVRQALDAYTGGNIVLSVPPVPYRCPIAPYERAAMLAEWLERRKLPGKVILLDLNPDIPIGKPAISGAFAELYKDRLEHHQNAKILGVNADTRTVETDKGKLTYGFASLAPPQQAAAIIRAAGLGERWAPVKFPSFLSVKDDRTYIIGDSVASTLPKSGHLAFETGLRVAGHIAQRARNASPAEGLDLPNAICFAFFNGREAMAVNIAATWNDLTNEVERKPMVDARRSAQSASTAENWSRTVWNDLTG